MRKITGEQKGYAQSLTFLGNYLKEASQEDLNKRKEIPTLLKEKIQLGHYTKKVLQNYGLWFEEQPKETHQFFASPTEETVLKPQLNAESSSPHKGPDLKVEKRRALLTLKMLMGYSVEWRSERCSRFPFYPLSQVWWHRTSGTPSCGFAQFILIR